MHSRETPSGSDQPNTAPISLEGVAPDYAAEFRRISHTLIERKWIIILCLAFCLGAGGAYIFFAPVLYSSTATIQVEQQERILKLEDPQLNDLHALDYLQTVAQSLKSRTMLERVLDANHLDSNPHFVKKGRRPISRGDLINSLEDMISVKLRRSTRLIDITVVHRDAALAATIANSLVQQYINEGAEYHVGSAVSANEFLNKEAKRLGGKLGESENALQAYKENAKSSSLDERQNTVVAGLKDLSKTLNEAKSARIKAEVVYNQAVELGTNVTALMTLTAVGTDPNVAAAQLNLAKAETDFAVLRQRYKEKHPKYNQAMSQILELRNDLRMAVLKTTDSLKANLEAARAAENAVTTALRAQEISALEVNKLSIQYGVLAREVESDRLLYESVLSRLKETGVTKEIAPSVIRVIQTAFVPEKPFSPKVLLISGLSVIGGLFTGILAALALQFIDSSVKTVDEAEARFHLPVLAAINKTKDVRRKKSPLVVSESAHSAEAEAFRSLRTSLSMLGRVDDRRVFLFTSSVPQEGKTFCSVNYAASLAQVGLKTLLIDCDLRRPMVETSLVGQDSARFGVTDYLTGQKALADVMQPTRLENLFFISGGTTAPNPAEMIAQGGLALLIEEALREFDRIVIDSAPIHAVSDTLLMVKSVQTVCVVVRAAATSGRSVARCIQLLQAAGAPLSGTILNQMPVRRGLGYDSSESYYSYAYHENYSKNWVYGISKSGDGQANGKAFFWNGRGHGGERGPISNGKKQNTEN
jgi:capsular exopolysaccharide synthesis family protein